MKKILSRMEFEKKELQIFQIYTKIVICIKKLKVAEANNKYYWVILIGLVACLQLTQDLFVFQEIIYKTRPDIILGSTWPKYVLPYLFKPITLN